MVKKFALRIVMIACLLSFPIVSYADGVAPDATTGTSIPSASNYSVLRGTASGDSITEYGFEYGATTEYGSTVSSTDQLSETGTLLEKRSIGTGRDRSGDGDMSPPGGIAQDSQGNLFVVDRGSERVQKFSPTGEFLLKFGSIGIAPGEFNWANAIVIDSADNIYVADEHNHRVQKFDTLGNLTGVIDPGDWDGTEFNYPVSLAVDASKNLYVTDSSVSKYDEFGNHIADFELLNSEDEHVSIGGIFIDGSGNIFATDTAGAAVHKYDSTGMLLASFDVAYSSPENISVDSQGNIYVLDSMEKRVQIYNSLGDLLGKSQPIDWAGSMHISDDDTIYVGSYSNVIAFDFVSTPGSFSLHATNLNCATPYHFRAFATNENGTSYGQDSTFTSANCPPGPDNILTTPTGRAIELTWTDNSQAYNLSHYLIQFKKSSESEWTEQPVAYNELVDQQGAVVGLQPNTQYDLRVATVSGSQSDELITSDWSDIVQSTTTSVQTFEITTCEEFQSIGINPVTKIVGDQEAKYILANDIDCSASQNWTWSDVEIQDVAAEVTGFFPIMNPAEQGQALHGFRGELDGAGHTVANITQTAYVYGGIFYSLQGSYIHDVTFDALSIQVDLLRGAVGGLAARGEGSTVIERVSVNGVMASSIGRQAYLAQVTRPNSVVVGSNGNVFVGQYDKVIEIDEYGYAVNTFSGSFNEATDIDVDNSGNVYITDRSTQNVYKFGPTGTLLGSVNPNLSGSTPGNFPKTSAIAANGDIYIVGWSSEHPIQKFDSDFNLIDESIEYGEDPGQLRQANAVAISPSGNVYVTDTLDRVTEFDSGLNYLSIIATAVDPYDFNSSMAFDSAGNFYVGSGVGGVVQKFSFNGAYLGIIGPVSSGRNHGGWAMTVDPQGNIYRVNHSNQHLEVYDAEGNFLRMIGSAFELEPELNIGGMIGSSGSNNQQNMVTITKSSVDVDIEIVDENSEQPSVSLGGVIGLGLGHIDQTTAGGTLTVSGGVNYFVGGLAGNFAGSVVDSYANSDIEVSGDNINALISGGLVGMTYLESVTNDNFVSHAPSIESSYAWGSITATGGNGAVLGVGGAVGMFVGGTFKDVFSASTMDIQMDLTQGEMQSPPSGLVGMLMTVPSYVSNNAFDVSLAGTEVCYGLTVNALTSGPMDPSEIDCALENNDGTDPDHFKNNNQVEPLDAWNFQDVWESQVGKYPQFRGEGDVVEEPPTTTTTTTPTTTRPRTTTTTKPVVTTTTPSIVATAPTTTIPPIEPQSVTTTTTVSTVDVPDPPEVYDDGDPSVDEKKDPEIKAEDPWLILGVYSLTGSNVWDIILISLNLILIGFAINRYMQYRKRKIS